MGKLCIMTDMIPQTRQCRSPGRSYLQGQCHYHLVAQTVTAPFGPVERNSPIVRYDSFIYRYPQCTPHWEVHYVACYSPSLAVQSGHDLPTFKGGSLLPKHMDAMSSMVTTLTR